MAIDFNSGTGALFNRLGRIAKLAYVLDQYEAGLPALFSSISDQYEATLQDVGSIAALSSNSLSRVASGVMGFSLAQNATGMAWATLVQMVYNDQPSQSWTQKAAMSEVIRQMRLQSKTVQECTIASTATVIATSVGTGVLLLTTKRGDGLVQENTIAETPRITCTIDSYTGTATQGQEQFSLVGAPSVAGVWDYDYPTGSAAAVQINAVAASQEASTTTNLLTNGDLEDWTGSPAALDNWTLDVGTWGTDAQRNSTTPYQGTYDLQINAGATNTALYQQFNLTAGTEAEPAALTSYGVNFFIMRTGVVSAGVLTVELVDDTNTVINDAQGTANSYTITLSSLTTSYAASNAVFRLPANPPDVVRLQFRISTDLAGANIRIDSIAFAPMTSMYAGGPAFKVFSGAVPFVGADGWTLANTNNRGGATYLATWQAAFERLFAMRSLGLLLPSSGTPNILDTLITT